MSNKIKNVFTIKDLENLTGIKAHTIRIWEKRYAILEPMRTESNIRYYDISSLQKLLNVSTLNSFGYKISNIAKIPPEKIPVLVKEILSHKTMSNHVLNNFKLAMMNFDLSLFSATYATLQEEKPFRTIFYEYFLPLLEEIGMLWQTGTITPAHEHFISALIRQKIAANTEKLQLHPPTKNDNIYVLYLPEHEIHEIGLMFINYELLLNVIFITYSVSEPGIDEINRYVRRTKEILLNDKTSELYIFGRNTQYISTSLAGKNIKVFSIITEFTNNL